jgi:hypothetical protein
MMSLPLVSLGRSGAAAAEFALVVPILTTLLFGSLEYGGMLYGMSSMQLAANVVARDVAVNNLDPAAAQARVQRFLPGWMRGHVTVNLVQSNPGTPHLNVIRLRLEAPSSAAAPISLISRLHSWTVSAEADVRQEPPYVD